MTIYNLTNIWQYLFTKRVLFVFVNGFEFRMAHRYHRP